MSSSRDVVIGSNVFLSLYLLTQLRDLSKRVSTLERLGIGITSKDVTTSNGKYCEPYSPQLIGVISLQKSIVTTYLDGNNICFETYDVVTSTDVGYWVSDSSGNLSHYHVLVSKDVTLRLIYVKT